MQDKFTPPTGRESLGAVGIALLVALMFLGEAVLPNRFLAPFPPGALQPERDEVLAGQETGADLLVGNPQMGDKYTLSLAWDRCLQARLRDGELPRWYRDFGGGSPAVPLMGQIYQPWNVLLTSVPVAGVYGLWYCGHLVLFGFFAYRFLRRLRSSHLAALFGMVALELGFWGQARVHHNVILTAALPTFAVLSCVHHLLVHRGGLWHVLMLAVGVSLSWLSGFAPVSLQLSYVAVAYALYLAFRQARGRRLVGLSAVAAGMALGVLIAAAQILPVLLAAGVTSRPAFDLATIAHSGLEWDHLLTLGWPNLFEWPATAFYGAPDATHPSWASLVLLDKQLYDAGFNFPETAFHLGLVPLVLAALGLLEVGRDRDTRFFALVAVFGLATALVIPGVFHAVTLLPGTSAGDVKRFLFLFALGAPVLVAKGVDRLREHGAGRVRFLAMGFAGLSLLLALLHLASPASLLSIYGSMAQATLSLPDGAMEQWVADYPDEAAVNRRRLLVGFFHAFAVAAFAVPLLGRFAANRVARALLLALAIGDLLIVGWGTRIAVPISDVRSPPKILGPILEATARAEARSGPRPRLHRLMPPDDYRWMNIPLFPNLGAYWGIEDLCLYCSLPKARMEEFFVAIEPDTDEKVGVVAHGGGVYGFRDPRSIEHPLLDLLGVDFLLAREAPKMPGVTDVTPPGLPGTYSLLHRDGALPRATFVTEVEIIPDRADRLRRLSDPTRDVAHSMILEDPDARVPTAKTSNQAVVTVTVHAEEEVLVQVRSEVPGYLRLADPYDAGWTVRVDGQLAPVLVADHYLRAVYLPAGRHEVRFAYDGSGVVWPIGLSLSGLLLALLLAVLGLWRRLRLAGSYR